MRKLLFLIAAFSILQGHSQDMFFSQVNNNPLHLNPANAGMMDADNRFSAFYRDQWRAVSSPYMTTIVSYERKAHSSEKEMVGVGLHVFYDQAGDGNLSTLKIDFSGAYGMHLNDNKQILSLGFRIGYGRRAVDLAKLNFTSQGGDPSVSSGEVFNEKFSVFDFGVGLSLKSVIKEKHDLVFGIAIDNLSNPVNSFNGIPRSRFIRLTPYLEAKISATESWMLMPAFYFNNQNANRQYLLQLLAQKDFKSTEKQMFIDFGVYYRVQDALIPTVGFGYEGFKLGFSYDINISTLRAVSNAQGAFELGVIYAF